MNINPLFESVINAAVFFATADDDSIDPDVAVAQLEQLGATMSELDETVRNQFAAYCQELAAREAKEGVTQSRVNAIREMPENMGLIDE